MEFLLISLLCLVPLTVGEVETSNPGELDLHFSDDEAILQHYPSRKDDQMYHDVALANYDSAISKVQEFIDRGEESVIKSVVDKLIGHKRIYVAPFAYKLYLAGYKSIVLDQFPAPYRMVFNDSIVKLSNNKYDDYPIEYSRWEDWVGDYPLYANERSSNSNNFIWKIEPVDDGRHIYFKIRLYNRNIYMKLSTAMDSDGDHQAFGSTNSDTDRHLWMFQPVDYYGKLSFCIINRAHYQALKVAAKGYEGYRKIYSSDGAFYDNPERFGWRLDVVTAPEE